VQPQPNSKDHPEVIEWMKRLYNARMEYVGFNDKDPSNYLDEAHRDDIKKHLYEAIVAADNELTKWCEHYGVSVGNLV
jgi:hypothetical protein